MKYERIEIALGARSYPILIGPALLRDTALLNEQVRARQLLIVTNEVVAPLYAPLLQTAFASRNVHTLVLPDGEQHKTLGNFAQVIDALIEHRMNRDAAVIALGGGVIGDMTGFAAACYQRGIDYVQIPTTLLAQVDSSVGGKTAVNHPRGKNMIGAFHQPRCVLADTETLTTLPDREYRAGLAEVAKYGVIHDPAFFTWLEVHAADLLSRSSAAVMHAVRRSCEIKAAVVSADEHEHGLRAILNFGHTFGHAIETAAGYGVWLHGEAVAAGMVMATDLSARLRWISTHDQGRIVTLLERLGLPVTPPRLGAARARELMGLDKKVLDGKIRLVLLRALGRADVVSDYPPETLNETLRFHFGTEGAQ